MRQDVHRFRPLAGFWFLNYNNKVLDLDVLEFPSPCGVLVLKFDDYEEQYSVDWPVSVPLRGSGS